MRPASPGPRVLAEDLLVAMSAIRRNARRTGRRPALLFSLSGSQLELLRLVRRNPQISVARAAEELSLAPNTVSTLVGQLTEAGLLERRADSSDRRVARLDLAPEARKNVEGWLERRSEAVVRALGHLRDEERTALETAVPALLSLADELDAEADR
jgi:DNA-binding MarR family transcriptional regulator